MGDWMWWIMTCGISLYFVMLLLDFNKPSRKLMDQISSQSKRRKDLLPDANKRRMIPIEAGIIH